MSNTIKIYAGGLEGSTITSTFSAAEFFPHENVLQRKRYHAIWKPANYSNRWNIQLPAAAQMTDLFLINNTAITAGLDEPLSGEGIWLWTSDDDSEAGTGTKSNHIGAVDGFHQPVAGEEPIWHEHFSAPGAARAWWHLHTQCDSVPAEMAKWQLGPILISKTIELPLWERPRKYSIAYGLGEDQTTGGYDQRILHHGKRYAWDLNWIAQTDAEMDLFVDFWDLIKGGMYPFIYEDENNDQFWVEAIMNGKLPRSEAFDQGWTISLTFKEKVAGLNG